MANECRTDDSLGVRSMERMWDGEAENSGDMESRVLTAVWQAVEEVPEICGGVVWCWADFRHRPGFTNDFPTYFGPFGIVRFDRTPKRALSALRTIWAPEAEAGEPGPH